MLKSATAAACAVKSGSAGPLIAVPNVPVLPPLFRNTSTAGSLADPDNGNPATIRSG